LYREEERDAHIFTQSLTYPHTITQICAHNH
jgi:hypothetical protein